MSTSVKQRDMSGCHRHPPNPRFQPFAFYSSIRLGDPEMVGAVVGQSHSLPACAVACYSIRIHLQLSTLQGTLCPFICLSALPSLHTPVIKGHQQDVHVVFFLQLAIIMACDPYFLTQVMQSQDL
jgi:hypothetical protein